MWGVFGARLAPARRLSRMRHDLGPAMSLNVAARPGVALVLGVLCVTFGVLVYYELDVAGDQARTAPIPAVAGAVPPLPAQPASSTLPPMEAFSEVTRRPLFSSTRQPPPPEAVKETQGNSSTFALLGIIISDGGRIALIEYGRPPAMVRLKEGQAVEGWTLQSILPDRVVLQRGATDQELKLKDRAGQPAQAGQPGQPRPPVPPVQQRPGRG
jgi:general secretion pathway protein N